MKTTSKPYRPNVGIMLINKKSLVWVGERLNRPGHWQMPQGGIEDNDTIKHTAYKELKEETGIDADQVTYIGKTDEWVYYDYTEGMKVRESRREQFQGQKQKFVLFYFNGKNKDIDLAKATEEEFSQWKWEKPQTVIDEVLYFRQPSYKKAFAFFAEHFSGE